MGLGRRIWGRRLVTEGRRVCGGGLGEGDGLGREMGWGRRLMRCAVYEVLLPLMIMITAHRQTHTHTHTHTRTHTLTHRNENSISASFTPFTWRI